MLASEAFSELSQHASGGGCIFARLAERFARAKHAKAPLQHSWLITGNLKESKLS